MAGLVAPRHFEVLKQPHITERAVGRQELGIYVFGVALDADKKAIRNAVETIFEVRVMSVKVVNCKAKQRRTRYGTGYKNRSRKAYVRISDDDAIDYSKLGS